MSDALDPSAYGEQIAFLRDTIRALADEALVVFREDFVQFFHREARRRFLASPEFARSLSDEGLRTLKAAVDAEAKAATERLVEQLRSDELWLSGADVPDPSSRRFEDNPRLWEAVSAICREVEALLEKHAFPRDADGGYGVLYHEPKRFLAGLYMPSIAEKYWKRIAELREVQAMQKELLAEREKSELLARWNQF